MEDEKESRHRGVGSVYNCSELTVNLDFSNYQLETILRNLVPCQVPTICHLGKCLT